MSNYKEGESMVDLQSQGLPIPILIEYGKRYFVPMN